MGIFHRRAIRNVVLLSLVVGYPSLVYGTTVISLVPDVVVEQPIVKLADIASIQGGSRATIEKLKSLEVTELESIGAADTVSASRIEYVLLLNGIEKTDAKVEGKSATVSLRGRRSTDERVLDAIRSAIAVKLGEPESNFEVQLTRPLPRLEQLMASSRVQIRVFPFQTKRLGTQSVRLGIYADANLTKSFSASVDVSIIRNVPVAKRLIRSNEPLAAEDFEWKSMAIQELAAIPETTELIGNVTSTRLKPGDIIRPVHIRQRGQRASAQKDYVVSARDNVKVIARKGPLRVTLGGAIALQRGRIGDTIRLRNPTSRKTVTARLISSDTAELRL